LLQYKAEIVGAGLNNTDLKLNITYETQVAHAAAIFRDTAAEDLDDPGFPCLTRRLIIRPFGPGHYLAPGKTLLFTFPFLETQVWLQPYSNTSASDPKAMLTPNEGMYINQYNPWSQYAGEEVQAWCDVKAPNEDLIATCHINPSARYGCPFRHPTATPRQFTPTNPPMSDSERCKYKSPLHRDKLCVFGYSGIEKFTVYNSEEAGGTSTFDFS